MEYFCSKPKSLVLHESSHAWNTFAADHIRGFIKRHFYKIYLEISSNLQIFRILAYLLLAEKSQLFEISTLTL